MDVARDDAGGGTGSARHRRERRLRQWHRHERMTVAMALAEFTHHSVPRGQKTARAGGKGGGREKNFTAALRVMPPPLPQAAGTQYFSKAVDDEEVPAAERPPPLREVGPQPGDRRHGGIGYELVLSNAVPQLGWRSTCTTRCPWRSRTGYVHATQEKEEGR